MTTLSLFMDFLVIVALGGTIFYAMKLSKSLAEFKTARGEMGKLMREVSSAIDDSMRAVDSLKRVGKETSQNLTKLIGDSRVMADELQIINNSAAALSERLVALADKGRRIAQGLEEEENLDDLPVDTYYESPARPAPPDLDAPAFILRDREFDEESETTGEFKSQAERDLFEALRRGGRGRG